MENKKIAALILMICLSTSMTGCGGGDTDKAVENAMSTEAQDSESIGGTEESTEPEYTECASYYLLDGVEETGKEYDMNTMEPDSHTYTLTKSVDIYYINEQKCGYTKENIDIKVIASNDDYCYVNLDHKYFLIKTKDVKDASYIEETETTEESTPSKVENNNSSNDTSTNETTKKDTSSSKKDDSNNSNNNNSSNTPKEEQPTNSQPVVEEQPEEPATSDKYTPEEAIAYYRSQVEAQGMQWDPSIKEEASWGTGWIPLSKDELNADYISNDMASYNMGDGAGNPYRRYYIEVTGSDENYVYVTEWDA